MNSSKSNFNLKDFGLKVTKPRLVILGLFQNEGIRHISADQVYERLRKSGEDVGIATVYRVLNLFEDVGILSRLNFDGEQSYYELNDGTHHDHLVCIKCNKVEEFCDPLIEKRQEEIVQKTGGKLINHSMNLFIECEECLNSKN